MCESWLNEKNKKESFAEEGSGKKRRNKDLKREQENFARGSLRVQQGERESSPSGEAQIETEGRREKNREKRELKRSEKRREGPNGPSCKRKLTRHSLKERERGSQGRFIWLCFRVEKQRRKLIRNPNTQLRLLLCFLSARNIPSRLNLIEVSRGTRKRCQSSP